MTTLLPLLQQAGPIGWLLIGYSLLALTIIIERLLFLLLQRAPPPQLEAALQQTPTGAEVRRLVATKRSAELRLLAAMIAAHDAGVRDLGRVGSRVGSVELQRLERGFRTLAILGNTAPLLGLLGTISGMIQTFRVIEGSTTAVNASQLAGGIWEALVTTGIGLAVALPILLLLHLLEGGADRRAQRMRYYGSLLLERVSASDTSEIPQPEAPVHHRDGTLHAM